MARSAVSQERRRSVTLSNAVVQSAQQLSLIQKRLVMCAVARLNPRAKVLPEKAIRISAQEYGETFGVSEKSAYGDLKRAASTVVQKSITMHRKTRRGVEVVAKYPWLSLAEYADGEGWVAIRFNPEIAPYLVDLKKHFTRYNLAQAGALRSVYTWRLLENLQMHHRPDNESWWQIDIEDFQEIMEAPASYRTNFAYMRKNVIDPSVAELKEKDGWIIQWKPIKRGRKVCALRFEYKRDPQGRLL